MTGTIELSPDGQRIQIRFPYSEDLLQEVRLIPGRRWDQDARVWTVPVVRLELVVKTFTPHGFTLAPGLREKLGAPGLDEAWLTPPPPTKVEADTPLPALRVSTLNERVRSALRGAFPEPVWVIGEVLDFDKTKGRRHAFFSLVEKQRHDDQPAARADVVLFATTLELLEHRLAAAGGLQLRDGLEIRALVRIDVYPQTGRYQLVLEDIDPQFTLGQLALSREAILAELRARGLARRNANLPWPEPALRIGVLASLDSDGWRDFVKHLTDSDFAFAVTCFAVRVQGLELRRTMLAGLRWFADRAADFDLLCILRGGGSRTDLAWFDDRAVALAVAQHPLKIVCGIGHDRDQSILDAIAHSEKTPTAVAARIRDLAQAAAADLDDRARSLTTLARRRFATALEQIGSSAQRLQRAVRQAVNSETTALHTAVARTHRSSRSLLHSAGSELSQAVRDLGIHGQRVLERAAARLDHDRARQRLLDPARILERGYALLHLGDGRIAARADALHPGMPLDIRLADGHARATITGVTVESPRPNNHESSEQAE